MGIDGGSWGWLISVDGFGFKFVGVFVCGWLNVVCGIFVLWVLFEGSV